jgi:hypothetical protein
LVDLLAVVKRHSIRSTATPPLGCGNGGLNWDDVRPRNEAAFAGLPELDVRLFSPRYQQGAYENSFRKPQNRK